MHGGEGDTARARRAARDNSAENEPMDINTARREVPRDEHFLSRSLSRRRREYEFYTADVLSRLTITANDP